MVGFLGLCCCLLAETTAGGVQTGSKKKVTLVLLNRKTALDQAIKDKTSTLEGMKSEENVLISAKDRCGYECVRVR